MMPLLPLLTGVAEFLLFAILFKDDKEHPLLWLNWFGCMALHALLGVAIVQNRIRNVEVTLDYQDQTVGAAYFASLLRNRKGAAVSSPLAFVAWLILLGCIYFRFEIRTCGLIQFLLSIVFVYPLIRIVHNANRDRNEIDGLVTLTRPK